MARPAVTRDTAPDPAFMRRETLVLDGTWLVRVGAGPFEPVRVPFAPQARVNAIPVPDGEVQLHYWTAFALPADWDGAVLHFEGVDREAEVRLDGRTLGRHAGAYDPFRFAVPRALLEGAAHHRPGRVASGAARVHTLEVLVRDSSRDRRVPTGKQEREPGEGNIFYANMSGIWKSVWIERAGPAHIAGLRVEGRASGRLAVDLDASPAAGGHRAVLRLALEGRGEVVAAAAVLGGRARIEAVVDGVEPWSPEAPRLYEATVSLEDEAGRVVDAVETYAGFRDFEMRDGYYRLNGRPFQFRGLLNQAIYPDTLYTPTDAHTLADFERTREQGFNGERRHQTTPRHRDLWLADRMGYWLSLEMPSARDLREPAHRAAAVAEWTRILRAYAWHPAVLYLAPGNENWGLLDHPHHDTGATDEEREAFQHELAEATEAVAPPGIPYAANDGWRLVTSRRWGATRNRPDPSRLMFNLHDYADNATLRDIYGRLPLWPEPGTWTWNTGHVFHDDSYSYDGRTPIVLSEVGGRAVLGAAAEGHPEGAFAYGRVHRDLDAWAEEVGETIELMGELPALRGGFVLTQTRDAGSNPDDPASGGEINGVLDAAGRPKHRGDRLRRANERAHGAWLAHMGAGQGA